MLPREKEEKRSLREGGERAKSKGRSQRRKREKQEGQTERVHVKYLVSFPNEMLYVEGNPRTNTHTYTEKMKGQKASSVWGCAGAGP